MTKEQQMEEMAKVLFDKYSDNLCNGCGSESSCKELGYDECGICSSMARDLQEAGYGNIKQAETEIERLRTELAHREEDLVHADEKVFYRECEVALNEKDIKNQAVKEFAYRLS